MLLIYLAMNLLNLLLALQKQVILIMAIVGSPVMLKRKLYIVK